MSWRHFPHFHLPLEMIMRNTRMQRMIMGVKNVDDSDRVIADAVLKCSCPPFSSEILIGRRPTKMNWVVYAYGPKTGPAFFGFFALWYVGWVGGWVGGCNNVLCLRCYVGDAFCTSVDTLHVTLDTPSVLRWRHFMLRWRRLLYFGGDTSCYVGDVYCTSVETLHVTLDTSTVLRWRHFMLRWRRLLYFGGDTSCYVGHVFCGRSVECSASVGKPLQRPIYEDGVSCPAR